MRLILSFSLLAFAVSACTDFPELDAVVSEQAKRADYPTLVAIDGILSRANDAQITPATIGSLQSRIAHLRARAAHLKRPVIDQTTRSKLNAAIARHS